MKPTPAMIGAAHDVTMKEAGIILSHELIAKIYEAMQAQAANADALLDALRQVEGREQRDEAGAITNWKKLTAEQIERFVEGEVE